MDSCDPNEEEIKGEDSANGTFDDSSFIHGSQRQGAKKLQEDAFFTFTSPNKRVVVTGVFDGHGGLNGKIAATVAMRASLRFFEENWKECQNWAADHWDHVLKTLFSDIHDEIRAKFVETDDEFGPRSPTLYKLTIDEHKIVRKSNGYPVHGGTTGTVVVLVHFPKYTLCVTANVGDSDAILIPENPAQKWTHLSVDHGPDSAEEFDRVKKLDEKEYPLKLMFVYDKANIFRKYECPLVFRENGTKDPKFTENPWGNELRPTNVRYDPAVYAVTPYGVATDITCIAMTRSLGDFYAHQYGLSYVPSVSVRRLDISESYSVCVASDGVWDCWKFDGFCDFVNERLSCGSIESIIRDVLDESIKRAIQNFGAKHFDDATAVLSRCVARNPKSVDLKTVNLKKNGSSNTSSSGK